MTVNNTLIPVHIIANVSFTPVPDYDGSETGLVKIGFDGAIAGQGFVLLPKYLFSEEFLRRIDWPAALASIHKEHMGGKD